MTNFKLNNGEKVKSSISGFQGLITARADHLNGCNRYWVQPPVDKDGKMQEGMWFDEGELERVAVAELSRTNNDRGGFPSKIK